MFPGKLPTYHPSMSVSDITDNSACMPFLPLHNRAGNLSPKFYSSKVRWKRWDLYNPYRTLPLPVRHFSRNLQRSRHLWTGREGERKHRQHELLVTHRPRQAVSWTLQSLHPTWGFNSSTHTKRIKSSPSKGIEKRQGVLLSFLPT